MNVSITIFNDPSDLGKSRGRKRVNFNYSFVVHDGQPAYTKIKFKSWAKATSGQMKNYKSPVSVKTRRAIKYFERAIDIVKPRIVDIIFKALRPEVKDGKIIIDPKKFVNSWYEIGRIIQGEAESIVRKEAFDTGDLLKSIKLSKVTVTS